tara:strand:- start:10329 stop:11069 length:741 start_codon:yes stop_codon:yes gene_type:complete
MKGIKHGIKLWSTNTNLYNEVISAYKSEDFDYLELFYIPDKEEEIQKLIDDNVPIIIHAQLQDERVSFEKGVEIFRKTNIFSNKVNSKYIILHPWLKKKEEFIKFLDINKENNKLTIENVPKASIHEGSGDLLGYKVEDIKEFLEIGSFNFCLDINHAIKSATSQGIDYKEYLKKFLELKPKIIHLGGGFKEKEEDEHLNLDEGNYDIRFIKELIKKSSAEYLTFEVPFKEGIQNNLKNINYFQEV